MGLSALIALAVATAQAPDDLTGHYVADVSEADPSLALSSSIDLRADAIFVWHLSMDGRVLTARGRWESECGTHLNLTSDTDVAEPDVYLAHARREPRDGLIVALEPDSMIAEPYLEVEAEYPDNYFSRFPFEGGQARIPAESGPPILAVRLFSGPFAFRSQAFPVAPDGDNRLSFRLVPGDVGQWTFSSQAMQVRDGGMTIQWRGIALRYTRTPTAEPGGGGFEPALVRTEGCGDESSVAPGEGEWQ